MTEEQSGPQPVDLALIRPYVSVLVLECVDSSSVEMAFDRVVAQLKHLGSKGDGVLTLPPEDETLRQVNSAQDSLDSLVTIIRRVQSRPSWLSEDVLLDTTHELMIVARLRRLIAVNLPNSIRDSFQRWLDKKPLPPVRRIDPEVLESSLLQGVSRGLWLKGTHSSFSAKEDSKTISGRQDLRDVLSPGDQSFALSSARSVAPTELAFGSVDKVVGTTPAKAVVWTGRCDDLYAFSAACAIMLSYFEAMIGRGVADPPFTNLAQRTRDFSGVSDAYDLSFGSSAIHQDDNVIRALEVLENAAVNVLGRSGSADFSVEIGEDHSVGGTADARVEDRDGLGHIVFNLRSGASDPESASSVQSALRCQELISVHYASGHTLSQGSLYRNVIRPLPFPKWRWADFSEFSVSQEKPAVSGTETVHDSIGKRGDISLFAWVLRTFGRGWLTCDDGAGEVADFVHVDAESFGLSLIHVKAAHSTAVGRSVAATAYEVVVAQALKNLHFLDSKLLMATLSRPIATNRASWSDGIREVGREPFLEALEARDARSSSKVVIVQPHVTKAKYDSLYQNHSAASDLTSERLRLNRLELLLNEARSSVIQHGAELEVYSAE